VRQYFFEGETDGVPFSRNQRAIVYQRAKMALDKRPFGTQSDVYADNYEWLNHSIAPKPVHKDPFRVSIGGPLCQKPYSASVYNISAMSFGALSANAIRALSTGARLGGFAQDTGEGGLSPYHQAGGSDIIWEIGSGYFGCRTEDGQFSAERFQKTATLDQVKMVEIKLSQGAKPGHGGVLPAAKVSTEIARIRGVPLGKDCISPARHSAFTTPVELVEFVHQLKHIGRQAHGLQALHRAPVRVSSDLQSDAHDRPHTGFHRRRWQGRRHWSSSPRVCRSLGHADARRVELRS
jgi:glutamate synthase domain-containing protein 2